MHPSRSASTERALNCRMLLSRALCSRVALTDVLSSSCVRVPFKCCLTSFKQATLGLSRKYRNSLACLMAIVCAESSSVRCLCIDEVNGDSVSHQQPPFVSQVSVPFATLQSLEVLLDFAPASGSLLSQPCVILENNSV